MEIQVMQSYAPDEVITKLGVGNTELEIRSWNLFASLLSIGRSVPPIELATRCTSLEVSTEFVEFVCHIPNSPLSLTDDGLVTVSSAVCIGLQRFLMNSGRVLKICIPREIRTRDFERNRAWEDVVLTHYRKRRRLWPNISVKADQTDLAMPLRISNDCAKVLFDGDDHTLEGGIMNAGNSMVVLSNDNRPDEVTFKMPSLINSNDNRPDEVTFKMPSLINSDAGPLNYEASNAKQEDETETTTILTPKELAIKNNFLNGYICFPSPVKKIAGRHKGHSQFQSSPHLTARRMSTRQTRSSSKASGQSDNNKKVTSLVKACIDNPLEREQIVEGREYVHEDDVENLSNMPVLIIGLPSCSGRAEKTLCQEVQEQIIVSPTDAEKPCTIEAQMDDLQEEEKPICGKEQLVCSQDPEQKNCIKDTAKVEAVQTVPTTSNNENEDGGHIEQKSFKKDKKSVLMKQKLKPSCDQKTPTTRKQENIKENKEKATPISVKGNSEPREMPMFDSFIVEEEEGSGGYGTVYKARSKKDGTTFAVKNPHVNANRHHVINELKMLERFGGKNFVIKYEGSFKSGNSHCLVLEHVAHDRPEVLKREIDVFQLRWYGYCLFKALASLHKQGVVHRDVKPGNFLFSLKASKGYLIDFNLAVDLHQKLGSATEKSKLHHDSSFGLVAPPRPVRKYAKKSGQVKDLKIQNMMKSQGADGSGITSTRDGTSTRVSSAERLREPIPCKGRQALINLVHEAMQGPDHEPITSKRKRVAAPPTKLDSKKFIYFTPMPLQSTGVPVSGAGLLGNKQRKEGPCVGTKGFRAPEVLFRSTYQGPKVDVWSAGVTLLYLIIGRTPFVGDPDQNIKEIARLRGTEALWEVAKLHDRESSFPPELFDVKSLAATELGAWCKQNTRRADFLEAIPRSLIDLVDKCLMVNPSARISAEEALRHEFFAPCFKELQQQKLSRQKATTTLEGLS